MNVRMWQHPATQENVATLRERGVEILGPAEGELAEGVVGVGRMVEPDEIAARIAGFSARLRWSRPRCKGRRHLGRRHA